MPMVWVIGLALDGQSAGVCVELSRRLMRVHAVTQRQLGAAVAGVLFAEIVGDGVVVARRLRERLQRQLLPAHTETWQWFPSTETMDAPHSTRRLVCRRSQFPKWSNVTALSLQIMKTLDSLTRL